MKYGVGLALAKTGENAYLSIKADFSPRKFRGLKSPVR